MTHRATRLRKRAERYAAQALEEERVRAEQYSLGLNAHWDRVVCDAFGLEYMRLEPEDLTHYYDASVREAELTAWGRQFRMGLIFAHTYGKFATPRGTFKFYG